MLSRWTVTDRRGVPAPEVAMDPEVEAIPWAAGVADTAAVEVATVVEATALEVEEDGEPAAVEEVTTAMVAVDTEAGQATGVVGDAVAEEVEAMDAAAVVEESKVCIHSLYPFLSH